MIRRNRLSKRNRRTPIQRPTNNIARFHGITDSGPWSRRLSVTALKSSGLPSTRNPPILFFIMPRSSSLVNSACSQEKFRWCILFRDARRDEISVERGVGCEMTFSPRRCIPPMSELNEYPGMRTACPTIFEASSAGIPQSSYPISGG